MNEELVQFSLPGGAQALALALQILAEIEAANTLIHGKVGDKADLAAIHTRVLGRRLKLSITGEVEG